LEDVPVKKPLHITFVCTYNVGRSPMAAAVLTHHVSLWGLADRVVVSSLGTSRLSAGYSMDKFAVQALRDRGYQQPQHHRAMWFGLNNTVDADLVVAMEHSHIEALRGRGVPDERIRLLRSFDPSSTDTEVANPGSTESFAHALTLIEAAMPGVRAWIDEHPDMRNLLVSATG
jgi:protein-tyrosine phosphatase